MSTLERTKEPNKKKRNIHVTKMSANILGKLLFPRLCFILKAISDTYFKGGPPKI